MSRFVEGEDRKQPALLPSWMGLHVLAYNMKRVMQILGTGPLMAAMRT